MCKLLKNFIYIGIVGFLLNGCTHQVKVLEYDSRTMSQQYIIGTLEQDIECKDIQTAGLLNLKINFKKGTKLIGEELSWGNFDLISLEGVNQQAGFANYRYNLLITERGRVLNRIHIKKPSTDSYPSAKCSYVGDRPIALNYNNNYKGKSFKLKKAKSGNFLAKLAGSALMVAVGSGAMGGEANSQSTELVGAALQDIWSDDKNHESEFKKAVNKQNNESISSHENINDKFQKSVDDLNEINQNSRNERFKETEAEIERRENEEWDKIKTITPANAQRAKVLQAHRIARAKKKLADAKAHDKVMRTSASNARKAEEARKLARASRGEIVYQGNTNNPTKSSQKEQEKIAIAYCWGKTSDYSKKKRFKCSGRIQLSLYPEDAKDKYDEARAVSAQLGLVGCTGKIGVNRAYDLGHATLFPVRNQSKLADYIGEGIKDGAWFKCYDHKLESYDNSAGKVSRYIDKERAKK